MVKWEFWADENQWKEYRDVDCQTLEVQYRANPTSTVNIQFSFLGGQSHQVDFASMAQINPTTNKRRQIKRVDGPSVTQAQQGPNPTGHGAAGPSPTGHGAAGPSPTGHGAAGPSSTGHGGQVAAPANYGAPPPVQPGPTIGLPTPVGPSPTTTASPPWEYQNDGGVWTAYLPADSQLITTNYSANPQGISQIELSFGQYTFHFTNMQQINPNTGTKRSMRRAGVNPIASAPTTVPPALPAGNWNFMDDDGFTWKSFRPVDNGKLEELFRTNPNYKGPIQFTFSKGGNHEVDFNPQNMQQRNPQTGKSRPMKRTTLSSTGGQQAVATPQGLSQQQAVATPQATTAAQPPSSGGGGATQPPRMQLPVVSPAPQFDPPPVQPGAGGFPPAPAQPGPQQTNPTGQGPNPTKAAGPSKTDAKPGV